MSAPVAWMNVDENGNCREFFAKSMFKMMPNYQVDEMIPLYAHPTDIIQNYESICLQCGATIYKPMRELTDEEIYAEMIKCIDEPEDGHTFRYKDFARAILRKAQEK
jgi:hypothetical protein